MIISSRPILTNHNSHGGLDYILAGKVRPQTVNAMPKKDTVQFGNMPLFPENFSFLPSTRQLNHVKNQYSQMEFPSVEKKVAFLRSYLGSKNFKIRGWTIVQAMRLPIQSEEKLYFLTKGIADTNRDVNNVALRAAQSFLDDPAVTDENKYILLKTMISRKTPLIQNWAFARLKLLKGCTLEKSTWLYYGMEKSNTRKAATLAADDFVQDPSIPAESRVELITRLYSDKSDMFHHWAIQSIVKVPGYLDVKVDMITDGLRYMNERIMKTSKQAAQTLSDDPAVPKEVRQKIKTLLSLYPNPVFEPGIHPVIGGELPQAIPFHYAVHESFSRQYREAESQLRDMVNRSHEKPDSFHTNQ